MITKYSQVYCGYVREDDDPHYLRLEPFDIENSYINTEAFGDFKTLVKSVPTIVDIKKDSIEILYVLQKEKLNG